MTAPSWGGALFGQWHRAGKLRRKCLSGGKVFEAPSDVIMLTVASVRYVVICDPALAVKRMHVVEARRHHDLDR
jgi:hypothetical protein